ncbi:MAG: ATP cone domain-containing protein [Candidatus Micrarchaeia archaeon]|jgi:transcriptional regulator NrdR family protein
MKVKKADGSLEDFKVEKIETAIVKAGGSRELAKQISQEVAKVFANKELVESKEIRKEVLARLQARDRATYASWLDFDKKRGKK